MPILAKLLISAWTFAFAWVVKYIGKKWALGVVFAGVFTSLTVALYGGLSLVLNALMITLPSYSGMEMAMYVAAPNNLPFVISSVLSAEATLTLYAWNIKLLRIMQAGG
ncbi:minor coat protein [Thauera sp. Sel9]|uniref:minor coat protein n=1 Tax=Thauera sp. Sel9 TaxID=2974299 RepID=UPI0021E14776|nr:minor coat protein [Thauera sp. Sel9]MCV2216219.1 minor coat protein [Thauera sp. Sel9]